MIDRIIYLTGVWALDTLDMYLWYIWYFPTKNFRARNHRTSHHIIPHRACNLFSRITSAVPPFGAYLRIAIMTGPQIKSDSKYDDYDYPTTSPEVKTGHPGHTSPEQDAQVFQLRTQLEQANYTERLDTLCMVRCASSPPYVSNIPFTASIPTSQEIQCRARQKYVGDSINICITSD